MKKYIWLLPILLLVSCIYKRKPEIPPINLLMLDSVSTFNLDKIPDGKPSVFIFFSPDCEHCQRETSGILNKMDSLSNLNLYFITIDPIERLRAFNKVYDLSKYPNIILGQDYSISFPRYFKRVTIPCTIIFDQDRILRARLNGETTASQIVEITRNLN